MIKIWLDNFLSHLQESPDYLYGLSFWSLKNSLNEKKIFISLENFRGFPEQETLLRKMLQEDGIIKKWTKKREDCKGNQLN